MMVTRLQSSTANKPIGEAFRCPSDLAGTLLPPPSSSPLTPPELKFPQSGMEEASFEFEANFDNVFVGSASPSFKSISDVLQDTRFSASRRISVGALDTLGGLESSQSSEQDNEETISIGPSLGSPSNPFLQSAAFSMPSAKPESQKQRAKPVIQADLYGVINLAPTMDPFSDKYGNMTTAEQSRAGKQSIVAPSQRRKSMDQGTYYATSTLSVPSKGQTGVSPSSLKTRKFSEMPLSQSIQLPQQASTSLFSNTVRHSHQEKSEPISPSSLDMITPRGSTSQKQTSSEKASKSAPASPAQSTSKVAAKTGKQDASAHVISPLSPEPTNVSSTTPRNPLSTTQNSNNLIDDLLGFGLSPTPANTASKPATPLQNTSKAYNQDLLMLLDDPLPETGGTPQSVLTPSVSTTPLTPVNLHQSQSFSQPLSETGQDFFSLSTSTSLHPSVSFSAPLAHSFADTSMFSSPQAAPTFGSSNTGLFASNSFFPTSPTQPGSESSVSLSLQSSYSHLSYQFQSGGANMPTAQGVSTAFLASQIKVAISETIHAKYVNGKAESLSVSGQIGFSFPNVAKYPLPNTFKFRLKNAEKLESFQPNPTFVQVLEGSTFLFTCTDYSKFEPTKPLTIIRYKVKPEYNIETIRVAPVWKNDATHTSVMVMCAINPTLKFNLDDFSVTISYTDDCKKAILQPGDGIWNKEERKIVWKIPSFLPTAPKTKLFARFEHDGKFTHMPIQIKFHSKHNLVSDCVVESENGEPFRVALAQLTTGKFEATA
eukprot:TRINITY_DN4346_c0_g1_i2.p1 TRINITY_DN4346_c0_g1~~TRINITY_DN4346_c0_g1_i2.p1  ORF type:complete len:769 (-),score=147.24 TRINITY_DN4346_c0_g1_i2:224-2530(-)